MRIPLDRAIVLRQPWAQAVVEGAFPVLLRVQPTNVREHVGVLAAKNRDPAGYAAPEAECPLGAIVGSIDIVDCIELDQEPRRFLSHRFGRGIASFYPDHFLPGGDRAYAWVISESVPAETPRDWDDRTPRTWARCNTWIEGTPVDLSPDARSQAQA